MKISQLLFRKFTAIFLIVLIAFCQPSVWVGVTYAQEVQTQPTTEPTSEPSPQTRPESQLPQEPPLPQSPSTERPQIPTLPPREIPTRTDFTTLERPTQPPLSEKPDFQRPTRTPLPERPTQSSMPTPPERMPSPPPIHTQPPLEEQQFLPPNGTSELPAGFPTSDSPNNNEGSFLGESQGNFEQAPGFSEEVSLSEVGDTSGETNNTSVNDPVNENTGPFSENTASYYNETNISVNNINQAWIENNIDSFVNTGWNKANYNTGNALISTGQAFVWTSVNSTANSNTTNLLGEEGNDVGESGMVVENSETGPGSTNTAEAEIISEVEINNENNFETVNEIGVMSNTGGNETAFNTGNGIIESGDAQAAVDLVTNANSNFLNSENSVIGSFSFFGQNAGDLNFTNFGESAAFESESGGSTDGFVEENISYFDTEAPILASNTTTGPNSENNAVLDATSKTTINNENQAVVENNVTVAATTGDNSSSYNTGHGIVESGDADLVANIINFINTNVVDSEVILATINVFGQWVGDLILPALGLAGGSSGQATVVSSNDTTGANSTNQASATVTSEFEVINDNSAVIVNDLNPQANTGENKTEYNTGSGYVETGDVNAQGSVVSVTNQNITGGIPIILIINTLGKWVGAILSPDGTISHIENQKDVLVYSTMGGETANFAEGPATVTQNVNSDTGPNSTNTSETTLEESTQIQNSNDLVVKNNVNLLADTGGNKASGNTGMGIITSGDANLVANLVNLANSNITGAKVIIAVINVFGEWLGNIVSPNSSRENPQTDQIAIGGETSFESVGDISETSDESSSDQLADNSTVDEEFYFEELTMEEDETIDEDDDANTSSSTNGKKNQSVIGAGNNDHQSGSSSNGKSSGEVEGAMKFSFDPFGFYTSVGEFLFASPQVLGMLKEKNVGLWINQIPKLTYRLYLLSLFAIVIIVSTVGSLKVSIRKPVLG